MKSNYFIAYRNFSSRILRKIFYYHLNNNENNQAKYLFK